ncbi:MAG: DUF5686 and carboxypeptidase regulatory-like domain-containing protein [Bacteroidia bacterium]|nr:DUF5686 and carboxypeptidase regulatory-like domain-containing protein [Bacteroidia bacterium]
MPTLRNLFLLLVCCFAVTTVHAQRKIRGKVLTQKGEGIAYVSISVLPANKLAYSNLDGSFEVEIPAGSKTLVFHSIDYLSFKQPVDSNSSYLEIVLKPQDYQLPELQVKANKINPAVYIMRKAISMAPFYRNQVNAYQAKVYLKGSGKLENVPFLLKPILKKQGYEEGKLMVTESVNELSFKAPNSFREKVISMRSSFKLPDGPQPLSMVRGNWYNTSSSSLVSPLSVQAFSVYDFVLEGSFFEDGYEVNKIKVIPKRAGRDLYKGVIYIIENRWSIHSLDLSYEGNGVQVAMKTRFEPLPKYPEIWMPVSYNFKIRGEFVGVSGYFHYLASMRDYSIDPGITAKATRPIVANPSPAPSAKPLPKSRQKRQQKIQDLLAKQELTKLEMLKLASAIQEEQNAESTSSDIHDSSELIMDSLAFFKDSSFWNQVRPVNLMEDELTSLASVKLDSVKSNPEFGNRFSLTSLLISGDSFLFKSSNSYFRMHSLLNGIYQNAPDGLGLKLRWAIGKELGKNQWLSLQNQTWIPFQRKALYGNLALNFQGGQTSPYSFNLEAGRILSDFALQGASAFEEFFLLSFYRQNPVWYYQNDYLKFQARVNPIRGLNLAAEFLISKRSSLPVNSFWNTWENNQILLQNPIQSLGVLQGNLNQFSFQADYLPGLRYYFKNGKRYTIPGSWPQFKGNFQTSIAGSDSRFSKLKFGLSQSKALRHWLTLRYQIEAGYFIGSENLMPQDRFWFAGNESWLLRKQAYSRFELLPYYAYSSSNTFLQAFSSWEFKRLILLRLPGLNLSRMREQLGIRFLATTNQPLYLETSWKLTRIWEWVDIGYTLSFSDLRYKSQGFRICFDIPQQFK